MIRYLKMIYKIKLVLYYLIISKLPHSRYLKISNSIRILYLSKILDVLEYDVNSKFEPNVYISDAKNIKIGRYVRINENVILQGHIEIGKYVMIAPNTSILTTNHIYSDLHIPMVCQGESRPMPVKIDDDVWIGRNCVILPGIHIGKGSIIGANTVVTKNVEPFSIVGGVPGKLIKYRNDV